MKINGLHIDKEKHLHTLWYENEDGDKYIPDLSKNDLDIPDTKEFKYQISRFPTQLETTWLAIINQDDVDACSHPEEHIRKTYGWIDGVEGRECALCGGDQIRNIGEPWPEKWDGEGSRDFMGGSSGWQEDLVLAIVDSSDYDLGEAIIIASEACERCMNALAHQYGLDWGYPEYGEEWESCGTSCQFCTDEEKEKQNMKTKKKADVGKLVNDYEGKIKELSMKVGEQKGIIEDLKTEIEVLNEMLEESQQLIEHLQEENLYGVSDDDEELL